MPYFNKQLHTGGRLTSVSLEMRWSLRQYPFGGAKCSIRRALDAAHRTGRSWKQGHNSTRDGYLLRKEPHALYDCGLLVIDSQGRATFREDAAKHYTQLDGIQVRSGTL